MTTCRISLTCVDPDVVLDGSRDYRSQKARLQRPKHKNIAAKNKEKPCHISNGEIRIRTSSGMKSSLYRALSRVFLTKLGRTYSNG